MRIILVHNRHAGDGALTLRELRVALEQAGHEVTSKDTLTRKTAAKLVGRADVVITAGGDGTVTAAARALAGTPLPLLPFPLGTANNIARCLGMPAELTGLLATLERGHARQCDTAVATGSWGERFFIESAGFGFFSDAVEHHLDEDQKLPTHAAQRLCEVLTDYAPRTTQLVLDGRDASDEYLLVEVLNFGMFGPNLHFAPDAKPDDGWLDVVLARSADRAHLLSYFEALARGEAATPPHLDVQRARHVSLVLRDRTLRIDSKLRPKKKRHSHYADLHVVPQQLRMWVPTA